MIDQEKQSLGHQAAPCGEVPTAAPLQAPCASERSELPVQPLPGEHAAVFCVHTVSGPTYACMRHTRMLINLMGFMGASSLPMPLDDDDPHDCANCVNEAKSRRNRAQEQS